MINFQAPTVWLAPMSGISDAPMRRQAVKLGAPAVVSEMVAGELLSQSRPDVVRRACRHEGDGYWIVQLAARRPQDMLDGANLLREAGVDVIDINMGCPSKQVTGGKSGAALMCDLALAGEIIAAASDGARDRPVTLKMRLGWDDQTRNAAELGLLAEKQGVSMLTVHGRTRCQFYNGQADWNGVGEVVNSVSIPVIVNGDIVDINSARRAVAVSGAHGVMVGRSALGRPWLPGLIARALDGEKVSPPGLFEQAEILTAHIHDSVEFYGPELGLKMIRKHIAAAIDVETRLGPERLRRSLRSEICQIDTCSRLVARVQEVFCKSHCSEAA